MAEAEAHSLPPFFNGFFAGGRHSFANRPNAVATIEKSCRPLLPGLFWKQDERKEGEPEEELEMECKEKKVQYDAIVLGAGKGERAGLGYNKVLYAFEDGQCVFDKALGAFVRDPDCRRVFAVCAPAEKALFEARFARPGQVEIVTGGSSRQQSVFNALRHVKAKRVLIHDGARCFVSEELIERVKNALDQEASVIPAVEMVDTPVLLDESGNYALPTPPRSRFRLVQTPQGFDSGLIFKAHELAQKERFEATDDASLIEAYDLASTAVVAGDLANRKITRPDDLEMFSKR